MRTIKRMNVWALLVALGISFCLAAGTNTGKIWEKEGIEFPMAGVLNVDNPITINGDPLRPTIYDDSTMAVEWNQGGTFYHQYFAQTAKGSVIFLNGSDLNYRWGGGNSTFTLFSDANNRFTPVSHVAIDPWTVQTVYEAGTTGVVITQTVSYINGSSYYKIRWSIANTSVTTFNNLLFFHGGDTYFANIDSSEGYWSSDLGMVYLTNETDGIAGIMGLYGGVSSPAAHYHENNYGTVRIASLSGNSLPDTVLSSYVDAGYALEWDLASLAPGQVWAIEAFEKWTDAGDVQVFSPAEQSGAPGESLTFQFVVQNFQETGDTFDLSVTSAQGWTTNFPGGNTITLGATSGGLVNVDVTIPLGASQGTVDNILLIATSQAVPAITNSDNVNVEVILPSLTLTCPNGGEDLCLDTIQNITWDATSISGNVTLSLWQNGIKLGVIADGLDPNSGSYPWTVGQYDGGVVSAGSGFFVKIKENNIKCIDFCDSPFTISNPSITLLSPNGSEDMCLGSVKQITWIASCLTTNIRISLWKDDVEIGAIASSVDSSIGSYNWTVGQYEGGTVTPASGYKIKLKEHNTKVLDLSDAEFTISSPILTVLSPNGGEILPAGTIQDITWDSCGVTDLTISIWKDGVKLGVIAYNVAPASGAYSWTVGQYIGGTVPSGSGYVIKLKEENLKVMDFGDSAFTISD